MKTAMMWLGYLAMTAGAIGAIVRYFHLELTIRPELVELKREHNVAIRELKSLRSSINETDILRGAMALVPGEIVHIQRDLLIPYDADRKLVLNIGLAGHTFNLKLGFHKNADGVYEGMVSQGVFPFPHGGAVALPPAVSDAVIWLNSADRLDLKSHAPQHIARSGEGVTTRIGAGIEGVYDIYVVIEENDPSRRSVQVAVVAVIPPENTQSE